MGLLLLILVTGTLLTRPTELVPELRSVELYRILILLCLTVSFPRVLSQFIGPRREPRPISVCVLGIWLAILFSHLSHGDIEQATSLAGFWFATVLYYFLLVGLVDSQRRLDQFIVGLLWCLVAMTVVSLLQFYDVIALTDLNDVKEKVKKGGELIEIIKRLRGPGRLFGDPNDVCSVFVLGVLLGLSRASDQRLGPGRFLWLVPIGLFLFAMYLTRSRGGFLALMVGLGVLFQARWGWRRTLWLGLPLLLGVMVLGGRQTDFSTTQGTGQQRIQIWAEGIRFFREAPLFGIGMYQFAERLGEDGLVAHNSYIHAFAEMGFFGGALFCGIFFLAITALIQAKQPLEEQPDAELRRFRPYLLATVCAYAMSLFSLSLCYLATTYLVFGLVTAWLGLAARAAPVPIPAVDGRLVVRLTRVGVFVLIGLYVFIRVFARF